MAPFLTDASTAWLSRYLREDRTHRAYQEKKEGLVKSKTGLQRFGVVVAISMVSCIMLGPGVARGQVQLFYDDFESYAPGTFPGAGGWQIVYGGAGDGLQYIDNTISASGVQSFHSVGSGCWAAAIQKALPVPSRVRFETKVYVDQIVSCGCTPSLAQMGLWKPPDPALTAGRIHFGCDGNIYAETQTLGNLIIGGNLVLLTSYAAGTWYDVRIDYDYGAKTFDAYIDGILRGQSIPILDDLINHMPTSTVIGAHHGANPVVWFDDVKVSEIPCTQPPSGMVSWWPGDGNAFDVIGGNNGTPQGGAAYAAGKVVRGFSLNPATGDYITLPHNDNLNPSMITVDAWIKTPAGAERVIVEKSHANDGGWVMEVQADGRVSFGYFNGDASWTSCSVFSAGAVNDDSWHHVAATLDGSAIKIYIDGVLNNSATYSGTPVTNSRGVNIGAWWGYGTPSRFFNGLIDEVEIFNRALTPEEIAAIHAAGSAGKCKPCAPPPAGLVSWWKGEGTPNDVIGPNNGTLVNGPIFAAGMVGQAFSFVGNDDYIQVLSPTGLPVGNSPRTMILWFKTPSSWGDTYQVVMQYGHNSSGGKFGLYIPDYWGRTLSFWGESSDFAGSTSLQLDTWYHGAVTYDGSTVRLYLNGQFETSQARSLDTQINANGLTIGRTSPSDLITSQWNGLVDEVAIFSRALTAEEIAAIYAAGSAGMCTSGSPDISVDLTEYDFGSVSRGGTKIQTFTVSNNGSADLTIGDLTVDPLGDFAVLMVFDTCSNSTVVPAASCSFAVQFSAYTAGVKNATLHIPSNDPDTGTLDVSLSGTSHYTLSVSVTPATGGTVTGAGINCGEGNTDCAEAITVDDQGVELTATPAAGCTFVRWEGDASGSTNPVTVQMSNHKSVTALFATDRQVCPTCEFTSVQDAIDEAQAGDTIKLQKDTTYHENILIETNKEITISGGWDSTFTTQSPDPFLTRIDGDVDGDGFGDGTVIALSAWTSERIDIGIRNLTIQNGHAFNPGAQNGGGIWAIASDGGQIELRLEDAVVAGNRAKEEGGGLYAHATGGTMTLRMTNTLVVDNEATTVGGIEFFVDGAGSTGALDLVNTTVARNRADWGGGLYAGGQYGGVVTADITNSILWGNLSRTDGGDITHYQYLGTATITASTSDIGTVEGVPGYSGVYNGIANISLDPVFINPVLWDYHLHEDSPAIDAGVASGAPGFDFEGEPRDASPDMGADEFLGTPTSTAIKLLSLNNGEVIDSGRPYDITWEAPDTAQSFKVFYTLDNGVTWLKVKPASTDPAYKGNTVNGYCHYPWDVPVLTKNKKVKIKVVGYTGINGVGTKVGTDTTDVPVLVMAVQLLTPNGGETLTGDTYTIRWETTEGPKAPVTSVKLSYTLNNGVTWKTIKTVTENDGSYSWTLSAVTQPKTKCKVKVELKDVAGNIIGSDMSDSVFTINNLTD
jgi:hypothetical protein